MNLKWYISTFIVTVALFFGVVSQQQKVVPNQEIVLQFSGDVVVQDKTEHTISIVKQQLENIGAENIQVSEAEDGTLKITYYSNSDVEHIKEILSDDDTLEFDDSNSEHQQFPLNNKDAAVTYNFDVFEIHKASDFAFSHAGKVAIELKASSHHYNNTNSHPLLGSTVHVIELPSIKVAYKFYRDIALAIDNNSKKIPEVRAGPLA
ncbi:hypothetical protein [Formosa algae]|uniref:Uncharacterized protein n=1 Tax=Formosa algae TaxID=225843 RepID=A0A9X0YJ97_9FLAO|nr:hypothetical protein [Formosa algae]MBP1838918.1 hypothetical protein [Formosa algae]MDQ0333695.1 hypothetical protein [Formosa algae]OEI78879.1 hypothetical protein AST99_17045 [Formosa algae]